MARSIKAPAQQIQFGALDAEPAAPPVEMVSPTGERQMVQAQHIGTLATLGYKQVTPEYEAQQAEQEKYGKGVVNELEAGALGAARGLTFGLSDVAIRAGEHAGVLPEGSTAGAEKLKQYNPDASAAGEIGSIVAPGLGAAGLLGKAGKTVSGLGIAQRGVSAGADVIGSTVAAIAKRIIGDSGGKIAGAAARMAAESAVYQAAHNISEQALADKDLTAEAVLANTGHAAILGAGIGAAIPASIMAGKAIAESAPVRWAVDSASDKLAQFLDPQHALKIFSGAEGRSALLQDTTPKGQKFGESVKHLWDEGAYKGGDVAVNDATGKIVQTSPGALLNRKEMLGRFSRLEKQTGRVIGDTIEQADAKLAQTGQVPAAFGFGDADIERTIGKIDRFSKTARINDAQEAALVQQLEQDAMRVRDAKTFGELHRLRQGLDARIGDFDKITMKPAIEITREVRKIVSDKIRGGLGEVEPALLERWNNANQTFGALKTVGDALTKQVSRNTANVNVLGLRFRDLGIGAIAGGVGGGAVGLGAALANKAIQTDQGLLARAAIGERVKQLAWAERLTNKTGASVADGVKAFVHNIDAGKVTDLVLKRVGPVDADITAQNSPIARRAEQQNWFKDTQKKLVNVAADPQSFAIDQGKALDSLSGVAPELRDAIVQNQLKILSYLTEQMPKNPSDPLQPAKSTWTPADYDVKKFRGVVKVAQNPVAILHALKAGTVTREQTQAVQALYPKIYELMTKEVQHQINDPKAPKLTYPQRLRLGVLFPGVESTLTPDFIRDISKYMGAPEQKPQGASGGKIRSIANLDLSKNLTTEVQENAR